MTGNSDTQRQTPICLAYENRSSEFVFVDLFFGVLPKQVCGKMPVDNIGQLRYTDGGTGNG